MSHNPPTFTFGDDNSPVRTGRKHRRGRGYTPPNRKNNANKPLAQAHHHHSTTDAWGNNNHPPTSPNSNSHQDDNDGTGSLTYSASSSVQSAESSNDSSFSAILKVIDSSEAGENVVEIKEFMARQSQAANNDNIASYAQYGKMKGMGMDMSSAANTSPAVKGWMQRNSQSQQQKMTQRRQQPNQYSQYSMAVASKQQSPPQSHHLDYSYSKDDSSEDDVYGVDFNEYEENTLETIAGRKREDGPSLQDSYNSSPNGSPGGYATPTPNSRHERASTPPGAGSNNTSMISRTNSRNSKSSSDGSWDTPAPSSPPPNLFHSKPPHSRSSPTLSGKTRKMVNKSGKKKDDNVVEDLSEAFYSKSWMCGFTDAFNFDGFEKTFQK
eukprot:CAMPEP_0183715784 /NCGR_PEP_ID=MMETSP0737-20130205/9892_1 /TAXON_ID=385413 /ORGANISM="Thalassiosira miniscula, Strain CCMP1093" /LENGTH=380 /DNA_ID=CAMNT_0025944939 /DNA_START=333 /DNA_END=1475 /DNA_ORIENTATION=-